MLVKREQYPILAVLSAALVVFSVIFVARRNYEFMAYVFVIIVSLFLVIWTNDRVSYPRSVLWGLTAWALMHMSGGAVFIGNTRLYDLILVPLVGEPYLIFKYDQLVHIIGFGTATLLMYVLLKPHIKTDRWVAVSVVILMAGLGIGALNEIIEFFAAILIPSNGVGGYENTSLDLVADLIGGLFALLYIKAERDSSKNQLNEPGKDSLSRADKAKPV